MKKFNKYLEDNGFDIMRVRSWLRSHGISELTMLNVFQEFHGRFEAGEQPKKADKLDHLILNRCKDLESTNFRQMVDDFIDSKLSAPVSGFVKKEDALFPTFKRIGKWTTGLLRSKVISRPQAQS